MNSPYIAVLKYSIKCSLLDGRISVLRVNKTLERPRADAPLISLTEMHTMSLSALLLYPAPQVSSRVPVRVAHASRKVSVRVSPLSSSGTAFRDRQPRLRLACVYTRATAFPRAYLCILRSVCDGHVYSQTLRGWM